MIHGSGLQEYRIRRVIDAKTRSRMTSVMDDFVECRVER
jgi:hypothetical protein